ncbi:MULTISPECIES: amidohydrolase [unclassified Bacillus (in: firmicutes)]|uniref:amidohydrolase n=1 Tax=unclassified Bacillus (in: firmicutes) TaxID=185979 RepID=UPI0008E80D54|nr:MULTISPECIES: amidohydrolase [unclassified Bacillus (in: firmicutes)]SFA72142.1 amidohydrolase [Bacillus sp. UNCCL13]SFQ62384.1 amidohydrolase [Bacillus sp. cl95]
MNQNYENQILEWFEHFHAHPEVSWKEYETTNTIAKILDELQIKYRRFEDVTGLVAEIGEGNDVIAVRAEIDALWQEVDGIWKANHSCGHSAIISMVLGALKYVKDEHLSKKIRFIFQPAEEKGNGSIAMIDHGAVENVSQLFGIHLRPIEELPLGKVSPSIHHGAGIFLEGKIKGVDAHGARPHQGKNAIDALFALHQFVKSIYISPFEPHSAKLTKILAGGESLNIIPGSAEFAIDVRAQKNEVLYKLKNQIEVGLNNLQSLYGVTFEWSWADLTPGAEVSAEAEAIARQAIIDVVGVSSLADPVITSGSDDFHFYTVKHPEIKATMIGVGADLAPGLHHPQMTFNKSALDVGARVLAETLRKA